MIFRWLTLFFLFFFPIYLTSTEPKKTVCLNMIVKNESKVITRCLTTVKPLIDYWVIVDTGSTDGTQEVIKDFMKDIPGELHEQPWVNFAHNRTGALKLAKGKADYVLFIDADEMFKYPPDYQFPPLEKDFYYVVTLHGGTDYQRIQLINNRLDWKWTGVLHEYVEASNARTSGTLEGIYDIYGYDGCRSQDPKKFQKDAAVLEAGLKDEPNNTRYVFYLAQSYRDAGDLPNALKNYELRASLGGWDQEVFWSLLRVAELKEGLNYPKEDVTESYWKAYNFRPSRVEPLYRLAFYHRKNGDFQSAYNASAKGLHLPPSQDVLFVERWIYDYGLLMEFSVSAYWIEKYVESLLATQLMLANPSLPKDYQDLAKNNLRWTHIKLSSSGR